MATVTKRLRKTWAFQDGERSGYLGIEGPVDLHKRISSAIVEAALRIGPLPFLGCSRTNIFEWAPRGFEVFSPAKQHHHRFRFQVSVTAGNAVYAGILARQLNSCFPQFIDDLSYRAAGEGRNI